MNKTSIEWVKNPDGSQGYTWNPITGCLNRTPEGLCLGGMFPCYAFRLANGRLRERYLGNNNLAPSQSGMNMYLSNELDDPFYPRFWPQRLDELRTWTPAYMMPPRGIFVCDMGELFGDWIPSQWQEAIFEAIQTCPQHRFYTLTKQPQNLPNFSSFPQNVWVGVTATNADDAGTAMNKLSFIEASVRFLSLEPLLEPMRYVFDPLPAGVDYFTPDWLIIGGMSGRKPFYPPESWILDIEESADRAGIPVFEKDNLRQVWKGPPRQEMP